MYVYKYTYIVIHLTLLAYMIISTTAASASRDARWSTTLAPLPAPRPFPRHRLNGYLA